MKRITTQQLQSNLYLAKAICIAFIISFLLLIYSLLVKEDKSTFITFFALAICSFVVLPGLFTTMKKINSELKTRGKMTESTSSIKT